MKKNFDSEVIRRTLIALDLKKINDIARLLNISQQNINGYIKRGTFLKLVEPELYKRKINLDWILTGQGEMISTPSNHISEQNSTYTSIPDITSQAPDDLLRKAAKVLRSNSSFRAALDSNIQSFHEAIELREDLDVARAELKQCQIILAEQTKLLTQQRVEIENLKDHINKLEEELLEIKSA